MPRDPRHTKRWQDVEELLDARNRRLHHVERPARRGLVGVVAQITGVVVQTITDAVFEKAYDVRLIDLPVGELLQRLVEGEDLRPRARRPRRRELLQEGNLIALRQLALRRTSDRVDAKIRNYRAAQASMRHGTGGARTRLHLLRVRTPCASFAPPSAWPRASRPRSSGSTSRPQPRFAWHRLRVSAWRRPFDSSSRWAVEPVTVRGENAAVGDSSLCTQRNVSKIVVGKPTHPRWRDILRGSFLDDVVRLSREVDVYVISGRPIRPRSFKESKVSRRATLPSPPYGAGVVGGGGRHALASWLLFGQRELADIVMVMLLGHRRRGDEVRLRTVTGGDRAHLSRLRLLLHSATSDVRRLGFETHRDLRRDVRVSASS